MDGGGGVDNSVPDSRGDVIKTPLPRGRCDRAPSAVSRVLDTLAYQVRDLIAPSPGEAVLVAPPSLEIGDGILISPRPVERLQRVEVSAVQLVAA